MSLMQKKDRKIEINESNLKLSSPEFSNYEEIPKKYTFMGENKSPPLFIENVPMWAKGLILMIETLDLPKNFVNWLVYDIDPFVYYIDENTNPGKTSLNSGRQHEYLGTMPLNEFHKMRVSLFAVDSNLSIPNGTTREELLDILSNYTYEVAELVGIITTKASHWSLE